MTVTIDPSDPRLLYDLEAAAEVAGIALDEMRRLADAGVINSWMITARRRVIHRADLADYLSGQRTAPAVDSASMIPDSGVYMLFQAGELVYVGRSDHMKDRIAAHRRSRSFDEVRAIPCDSETSVWLERELVRTLAPPENIVRFVGHTAKIRGKLALIVQ